MYIHIHIHNIYIHRFKGGSRFGMIPKPKTNILEQMQNNTTQPKKDFSPLDWHTAFEHQVFINNNKLPIYWHGNTGPNVLCLHGAGHSGLSFAPLALLNPSFRVISYDCRGHGYNELSNGDDLSQQTLITDAIDVLIYIQQSFPEENIVIIGHSMGGSIATKTCAEIFSNKTKYQKLFDLIQGLIVIDVVEGTAIDSLPFMENIVNSRPQVLNSIEKGIQYMIKSGQIKNVDSARISVPSLVKDNGNGTYSWKTNLLASEKYWKEWFEGLTKAFLGLKLPKMLMLAGVERMDKELTIAQMQGKYMLSVVRHVGHVIHEDNPEKAREQIQNFIDTFHISGKLEDMKPIVGVYGENAPMKIKFKK